MNALSYPVPDPATDATSPQRPLLDVSGVTLQYKTRDHLVTACYRVDFQLFQAERFVLLGPSGCGKSSLLKAVGGFLAPADGTISLNGRPVRQPGPDRMMVFQEFDQLPPWKTVKQNVMFPLVASGKARRREAEEKALAAIAKVNLGKFADSYPHQLSGGMKQRVAIARAMAMEPDILLMDEPFAALDALTRRKMQEELLQLWDDLRFTMLFVTHSIEEALVVGSRILVLSPHPGQVKAELNCHEFDLSSTGSPAFQATAQRIHTMLFADTVEPPPSEAERAAPLRSVPA
jgi:NitT/TauT family transport system ATP-binding protein